MVIHSLRHGKDRPRFPATASSYSLHILALAIAFLPLSGQAQPYWKDGNLYYDFNQSLQAPGNEPPAPGADGDYWLRAIVSSLPSENNTVKIRLESNTTSGAFIDSLGFRIHGYAGGTSMECLSPGLGSGACTQGPTLIPPGKSVNPKSWGYTNYASAGQVDFPNNVKGLDLQIFLPTSNKADRFNNNEALEFSLTSTYDTEQPTLLHAFYAGALNTSGEAAAAKIQGYEGSATLLDGPPSGGGSAPVPGPIPVLGAAGAFKVSRLLRRRLRSAR
ncbi:MAG: hypothetical protein VKK94_06580 [Cyanobacteriota bacterium]|nr:hypothetical protein [Cyanobacteriota bacterium]